MTKLSVCIKCLFTLAALNFYENTYGYVETFFCDAKMPPQVLLLMNDASDAELIKSLFAVRKRMAASEAYESVYYDELISTNKSTDNKLANQNEIAALVKELDQLQVNKAKQGSPKAIEKLELKEKDLLLKKAHLEIQDAPVLSNYTQSEYDALTVKVSEAFARLKSRIESRAFVSSEVQRLFREAEENMHTASEIMASGHGTKDRLVQTESFRTAFAHEALAITQLKQLLDIHNSLDILLKYSNDEIKAMANGEDLADPTEPLQTPPVQETVEVEKPKLVEAPAMPVAELKQSTITEEKTQPASKEALEPEVLMPVIAKAMTKKAENTLSGDCDMAQMSDAIFYTVQIGAFQKQVAPGTFEQVGAVCTDRNSSTLVRYTSGQYHSLGDAQAFLNRAKKAGITDAFITAYANGKRVTVSEATELLNRMSN